MTKSPLDRAVEGLYRELNQHDNDLSKIPGITRPIALLYMFQGMVDNGGFRYPMENDMPGQPPYSLISNSYRAIGANSAAEALDKAVSLFPFERPELDTAARNAYFDKLGDEDAFEESEFQQLSNHVCGDMTIWTRMDEYVAKHMNEFAPYITQ